MKSVSMVLYLSFPLVSPSSFHRLGQYMSHLWEGEWHQDEDEPHVGILNLKTKLAVLGFTLPFIEINAKAEQVWSIVNASAVSHKREDEGTQVTGEMY